MNEKVIFRLFQMPCCGIQICWVNPRLPNNCPECGSKVFMQLKFLSQYTLLTKEVWLRDCELSPEVRMANLQRAAQKWMSEHPEEMRKHYERAAKK